VSPALCVQSERFGEPLAIADGGPAPRLPRLARRAAVTTNSKEHDLQDRVTAPRPADHGVGPIGADKQGALLGRTVRKDGHHRPGAAVTSGLFDRHHLAFVPEGFVWQSSRQQRDQVRRAHAPRLCALAPELRLVD
jgi:hypothetical protein